ncbi:PRC-barrel domain-containing protein [Tistrella mobilis]|uniref:PRC-barrel domain-containing protein n=1 Tax=Tistrella mobilis (strain KA081020-065) TaxID=1110502 RepID=I3TKB0_TISMK|nr:PRC-barrel domain-containing protein [Tistrella mobilis]AFK53198.1 PRC-barrel domain-containing protein [Tistrella mobilis KA081020-065]
MFKSMRGTTSALAIIVGLGAVPLAAGSALAQAASPGAAPTEQQAPAGSGMGAGAGSAAAPSGAMPATPPAGGGDTAEAEDPQPADTLLSNDTVVRTPDGEEVASLQGVIFGTDGQITHAVLAYGGVLGFGAKEVMVPWDQLKAEPAEQALIASVTPEQLEQMPAFKSQEAVKSDADAATGTQPMSTTPAPTTAPSGG